MSKFTMLRIDIKVHKELKELSKLEGVTMVQMLRDLIKEHKRG